MSRAMRNLRVVPWRARQVQMRVRSAHPPLLANFTPCYSLTPICPAPICPAEPRAQILWSGGVTWMLVASVAITSFTWYFDTFEVGPAGIGYN